MLLDSKRSTSTSKFNCKHRKSPI